MSKRKLTYEDFKRYFSNNLQNKDKHAFEKDMMRDAFEEEAFDGLSQLSDEELEKDITELQAGIQYRSKNRKTLLPVWFRYAASVLVLVGIGLSVFVFLNNRLWHDSMIKEQISQEMEIPDSVLFDAEEETKSKSDSTNSTIQTEKPQLIAESRDAKRAPKLDKKRMIVQDKAEISEELILDEVMAKEADDAVEIIEFEEEEIVEEETPVLAAMPEQKATKAEKQSNVVIRGTSSLSTDKSPLWLIDGKLIDPNKSKTIQGKIINEEDQLSIPGVSIVLKDLPAISTTTDIDGNFILTIPEDEELKTLIASFVGMETQEISLDGDSTLMVYMEPEILEMDEVVVTAIGVSREKKALGYSVQGNDTQNNWQPASPPNELSLKEYKKLILQGIDYSKLTQYPGKYKINISVELNATGRIIQIDIKNSPEPVFDQEIKRVIETLGKWIPASENGHKIGTKVRFSLKMNVE